MDANQRDFRPVQTVRVVADSDTRWKWGAAVARRLSAGPVALHGSLVQGRATPSEQQLAEIGAAADTLDRGSVAEIVAALRGTEADVVVLACVGGTIQALLHGLADAWAGRLTRPLVVTGYVGVVYERVVEGLLLRAGADVLLANSPADAQRFRDVLDAVCADPDAVVPTALPFLDGPPHDPTAAGRTRPFTVTFAAQPSVPETRGERRYALAQALEHARRHPQRHVIVKLRGRRGEQTTHVERHHYATLLPRDVPPNVELAYGPMGAVLDRTDLCVTVSSTAALEAMQRGIPVAVLTDFGVRETVGNHVFLRSGALTSWPALHAGAVPKTDPSWAAAHGVGGTDPDAAVRARLAALRADPHSLPPLRPWLRVEDAAGYLPAVLARNGLRADGTPIAGTTAGTAGGAPTAGSTARATPFGRRLLRAAARRGYLLAVERVEPRVRRWAAL